MEESGPEVIAGGQGAAFRALVGSVGAELNGE